MIRRLVFLGALCGTAYGLSLAPGSAYATKLDDLASPRQRVDVTPRWLHSGDTSDRGDDFHTLIAEIANLEVRLNTASYAGRRARIYLVVPQTIPGMRSSGALRVEWRTRGALHAGSAGAGSRTPVFEGIVPRPLLTEIFDFTLRYDSRQTGKGLRFEPFFDIEVLK